jgi:hypothetical protein
MSTAIASAVDEHDLGIAGAFQQMVNQVGVAIGIQVMLAVQTSRDAAVGGVAAYSEAYLVAAAVAAVGVLLATRVRSTMRGAAAGRDEGAAHGDALEAGGSAAADLVPIATR